MTVILSGLKSISDHVSSMFMTSHQQIDYRQIGTNWFGCI